MLITRGVKQEIQPNFQLEIAGEEGAENLVFPYYIKPISQLEIAKMRRTSKKETSADNLNGIAKTSATAVMGLEVIEKVAMDAISVGHNKTITDLVSEYKIDSATQDRILESIINIAMGKGKDE